MSRTTYGMVDANALSGFEIVWGTLLWLVEILYFKYYHGQCALGGSYGAVEG